MGVHNPTQGEAVQVRIGNRWRNGDITRIRRRKVHVEIVVTIRDGKTRTRHLMDAASDDVRKHGEGVIDNG